MRPQPSSSLRRMLLRAASALLLIAVALLIVPTMPAVAADPTPTPVVVPPVNMFLDAAWYRHNLIATVDLWNGGLNGAEGMGVYRDDFDGFFDVNLNRAWQRERLTPITVIAQSRAIYINAEAYRAAAPGEQERFLRAVKLGADFLLAHFWDSALGGFFWEVNARGRVNDDQKQGYGNVHPMLALAHAYGVTHDPDYLEAALKQLQVIEDHFLDPQYPGGFRPGFNRDFSALRGVNNVDSFTHYFEALLALYDVTTGETQAQIGAKITLEARFLIGTLYRNQDGFTDRGYVAYNYDPQWQPSQQPYSRETQWSGALHASTGHNVELAYLLSRAVERGFDPAWLETADKLMRFCVEYVMHPLYGGMIYEISDYAGNPLEGNPDNPYFVWWAQGETARALLHFLVVRGRDDYAPLFQKTQTLINVHLTDARYGGWFQNLDSTNNLKPVGVSKGNVWKVDYHFTMFHVEVMRLDAVYGERVQALNGAFSAR